MPGTTNISRTSVDSIVNRIFRWKKITRNDQHLLMSALLAKESISPEEKYQIDRVFDAVNSGFLKVL